MTKRTSLESLKAQALNGRPETAGFENNRGGSGNTIYRDHGEFDDLVGAYSPLERNNQEKVSEYLEGLGMDKEAIQEIVEVLDRNVDSREAAHIVVATYLVEDDESAYVDGRMESAMLRSDDLDPDYEDTITNVTDFESFHGSIYHIKDLAHWKGSEWNPEKYQAHVIRQAVNRKFAYLGDSAKVSKKIHNATYKAKQKAKRDLIKGKGQKTPAKAPSTLTAQQKRFRRMGL